VSRAKHSAIVGRAGAHARYRIAEENCPHWDYESDGGGHECCEELAAAIQELRRIKAALKREGAIA